MTGAQLLTALLLIPLLGSLVVLILGIIWRRAAGIMAFLISLATLACAAALLPHAADGGAISWSVPWFAFSGQLMLRADHLSLLVVLGMAIVGALAILYSFGYYRGKPQSGMFYGLVTLFLGGMIGTAVAANLVLFYLFWEMMLVPSFALVTYWGEGKFAQRSGFKYFVFTHVGAVAMLAAFLWIYTATGVTDIYAIKAAIAGFSGPTLATLAGLMIFGFAVKMAIFPVHSWLPGAYDDAPVPVTAMISGAMISAGIYGMIRFPLSLFPRETLLKFQLPLLIIAVVTQLYGGMMALTAKRVRRILAYSSISQMGYVLFGLFSLSALGLSGSIFHLFNHGVIKALLFMVIGAVVLQTARQKTSELGGLAPKMPVTTWGCLIGVLAIAGVPPLNGFQSEWLIFAGAFASGQWALGIVSLVAGVVTAGYALLLIRRIFFGPTEAGLENTKEASGWILAPILIFTVIIIVTGIIPGPIVTWISTALKSLGIALG